MSLELSSRILEREQMVLELTASNTQLRELNARNKAVLRNQQAEIREQQKSLRELQRHIKIMEGAESEQLMFRMPNGANTDWSQLDANCFDDAHEFLDDESCEDESADA